MAQVAGAAGLLAPWPFTVAGIDVCRFCMSHFLPAKHTFFAEGLCLAKVLLEVAVLSTWSSEFGQLQDLVYMNYNELTWD